jgi:hypothetical protein
MKKNLFSISGIIVILSILFLNACKKDKIIDDDPINVAAFSMFITDPKEPHSETKGDIVTNTDLTKCEITISDIKLKNSSGNYVDVLTNNVSVDLRDYNGTVKDLLSMDIPVGTYSAVKVYISGVSTTYKGNNYSSSVSGSSTVTLADYPGYTLSTAQGVPNAFSTGELSFEVPLSFTMTNSDDAKSVRLFFDAEASTYVESVNYLTYTFEFAGLRLLPYFGIILEEGIQQIRHSPPYIINIAGTDVNYYGIHTFMDFNTIGGTIDAHTSQHVFRGENGDLLVDAENMSVNSNPLSPNVVNASGESNIRSDETFHYSAIISNLATAGHTIESGKTYYFSLRKTWTITSNGSTYDITRICEPMPVYFP